MDDQVPPLPEPEEMTWRPEMSVGVALLDEDHQALIDLINLLVDKSERTDKEKATIIATVIGALEDYGHYHFAREEAVLVAVKFPSIEEHMATHRQFFEEIERLKEMACNELLGVDMGRLSRFLQDWLTDHIMTHDMDYKPYVSGRPEADEAARTIKFTAAISEAF